MTNKSYPAMLMRILWITILVFSISSRSHGQYVVTKVSGTTATVSQEGFYYALPRTVLKVELLVEKIRKQRGPLADYSGDFLGTAPLININSTEYRILDVKVSPEFEADPAEIYFVQFPADRSRDETGISFNLTEQGTLLAFGGGPHGAAPPVTDVDQTMIFLEGDDDFTYYPGYNRKKKIDTITRKITIDTVSIERFIFRTSWVDKSEKERAEQAALEIEEIRGARFNLLTGYQEVNYGESIKYMDYQLRKMEQQYLALFLGKETVSHRVETAYFLPTGENPAGVLLSLDNGQEVEIRITASGNTGDLPEKPLNRIDNLYYRIPDMATVEVMHDGEVLYRGRTAISQLGIIAPVPMGNSVIQFDPRTGTLKSISRK